MVEGDVILVQRHKRHKTTLNPLSKNPVYIYQQKLDYKRIHSADPQSTGIKD